MDSLRELSIKYIELRDALDSAKQEQAKIQKEFDDVRNKLLPECLEEMGVESARLDGIGTVALYGEMYVSIPADVKEETFKWLKKHGHSDLIKPQVHPSTLKAFVKEQISHGEELPEDLFKVTPFTQARITKR